MGPDLMIEVRGRVGRSRAVCEAHPTAVALTGFRRMPTASTSCILLPSCPWPEATNARGSGTQAPRGTRADYKGYFVSEVIQIWSVEETR